MAIAKTQARFLVALERPRKYELIEPRILEVCARPEFANNARYKVKVGSVFQDGKWKAVYAEDFNIRAAEQFRLCYPNTYSEVLTVFEDDKVRRVAVEMMDLESNTTYRDEFTIYKTMERKKLKDGQEALDERMNSKNELIYIVKCTPEDVHKKQAAQVSKSLRNLFFRMFPIDLKIKAERATEQTILGHIKNNINDERRKIATAFYDIGIDANELEKYTKQKISTLSATQIEHLRKVYTTIKDGEANWKDYLVEEDDDNKTSIDLTDIQPKEDEKEGVKPQQKPTAQTEESKNKSSEPDKSLDKGNASVTSQEPTQKTTPSTSIDKEALKERYQKLTEKEKEFCRNTLYPGKGIKRLRIDNLVHGDLISLNDIIIKLKQSGTGKIKNNTDNVSPVVSDESLERRKRVNRIWGKLTEKEKNKFADLIRTGENNLIIPELNHQELKGLDELIEAEGIYNVWEK
jgi:hypothetical protein